MNTPHNTRTTGNIASNVFQRKADNSLEEQSAAAQLPLPYQINTDTQFFGTALESCYLEIVIWKIAILQKKLDDRKWSEFTYEQYAVLTDHIISFHNEESLLRLLVTGGGHIHLNGKECKPGYLSLRDGYYSVCDQLRAVYKNFVEKTA